MKKGSFVNNLKEIIDIEIFSSSLCRFLDGFRENKLVAKLDGHLTKKINNDANK
jgi:hypothetical protein